MMHQAGEAAAETGRVGQLTEAIFIIEGWMSTPNSEDSLYVPPSQDPSRIEVLTVARISAQTKEQNMNAFEMVRDEKGELIDVELLTMEDDSATESPLLRAFVAGFNNEWRKRRN